MTEIYLATGRWGQLGELPSDHGVGPTGLIDTEGNLSEKGAGNAQSAISPLESAN
jgi:hypothetical protein